MRIYSFLCSIRSGEFDNRFFLVHISSHTQLPRIRIEAQIGKRARFSDDRKIDKRTIKIVFFRLLSRYFQARSLQMVLSTWNVPRTLQTSYHNPRRRSVVRVQLTQPVPSHESTEPRKSFVSFFISHVFVSHFVSFEFMYRTFYSSDSIQPIFSLSLCRNLLLVNFTT